MSITLQQVSPSTFLAPANPLVMYQVDHRYQFIRFTNNSPYQLSVDFGGNVVNLGEFRIKDLEVPQWFQGTLKVTPTINISTVSHAQSNSLIIEGYYKGEVDTPVDQAIPQQAVTATASGKPLFSANFGQGVTLGAVQALNVFNPPNSGVNMTFHSARVFSNDSTIPLAQLAVTSGGDLNLPFAVAARSHDAQQNPPVSFAHVTADDSANPHGATNIEILDLPASLTQDLLAFPDQYTLEPGNNLTLSCNSGVSGKAVRLALKWNEDIAFPPQGGVLTGMAITTLVNQGNPAPTPIVTASPAGDGSTATLINNDGTEILGDASHPGVLTLIDAAGNKAVFIQANSSPVIDLSLATGVKALLTGNNKPIQSKDSGGTARDVLWVDGSNQTNLQGIAGTDLIFFKESNGTVIASAGVAGINLDVGGFNFLTSPVTVNGSVSGTASAYQVMRGTFKYTLVYLNAWRSASAVNITLPTPYTTGAWVKTGGIGPTGDGGFKLLAASIAQTINIITALAIGGGTTSPQTQMYQDSIGECVSAFDQVAVWSNTGTHTGFILLEGI